MGLETLTSGGSPIDGSVARPVGSGRYGIVDQVRQQQALVVGMAICWENSADASKRLNVWKYGDSHSRPELGGVCATTGNAPTLQIPVNTTNATTSALIFAGYTPILLAPGEVVRHGQYLEPIGAGTYQAMWRVAPSGRGPAMARESFDNSAEDATEQLIGADLFINSATDSGLAIEGAVGPSAAITGVTVETAYDKTVIIPANSLKLADLVDFDLSVLANTGAAGGNVIKVYINGIGSGVIATSPSVTYSNGDVYDLRAKGYVSALSGSSATMRLSGFQAFGAPGTATARPVAASLTFDPTVDNEVTVAVTPNNNADSSTLQFLSVGLP